MKHPILTGFCIGYVYGVICLTFNISPLICGIPFAVAFLQVWWKKEVWQQERYNLTFGKFGEKKSKKEVINNDYKEKSFKEKSRP